MGLSATPGRDLKSIGVVIENLGVSKVEARIDTDAEVKPYTHDRKYEVISVEQPSEILSVERLVNNLLDPLINMLRERGGLRSFRGTNATLTHYNVLMSMREHMGRDDYTLVDQFKVIQSLLSVRQALRENGIGFARSKLFKFMHEFGKRGGFGGKVAQSEDFQKIWCTVVKAQDTGKSYSQDDVEDLKLNNPKLDKLEFILKEHFERARVLQESSRAIVFSQWRDSVEEIVNVLQASRPLIKATKFVGQGTGSFSEDTSTPTTKRTTTSKVAGMNQKEQQKVLREFRVGIHNVLVCTCKFMGFKARGVVFEDCLMSLTLCNIPTGIGEEGLDIGQVDLIVNFDCLSSPIRMVQRTGRTGRSRNGRVVCLVSKGQEEERLRRSETATKTLWNALKNPSCKAFNFAKNIPLLPAQPELKRENMNIVKEYRLSQIGGHSQKQKKANFSVSNRLDTISWRLNGLEEMSRVQELGQCAMNKKVYKEALKAWQNSIPVSEAALQERPMRSLGRGPLAAILRIVETATIVTDEPATDRISRNLLHFFSINKDDSSIQSQKLNVDDTIVGNGEECHEEGESGQGLFLSQDHDHPELQTESDILEYQSIAPKSTEEENVNLCNIFGHVPLIKATNLPDEVYTIIFGIQNMNGILQPTEGCSLPLHQFGTGNNLSISSSIVSVTNDNAQDVVTAQDASKISESQLLQESSELEEPFKNMNPSISNSRYIPKVQKSSKGNSITKSNTDMFLESDEILINLPEEVEEDSSTPLKSAIIMRPLQYIEESTKIKDLTQTSPEVLFQDRSRDIVEDTKNSAIQTINDESESSVASVCFDLPTQNSSSSSSSSSAGEAPDTDDPYTQMQQANNFIQNPRHESGNHMELKCISQKSSMNPPSRLKLRQTVKEVEMSKDAQSAFEKDDDQEDTPIFHRSRASKRTDLFLSQFPTLQSSSTPHNKRSREENNMDLIDTPLSGGLKDTPSSVPSVDEKQNRVEALAKRRKKDNVEVSKFFDIEVEASGSESDGESEHEDEECSQDSFINDSSQLGFTQDVLDTLDCDKSQLSNVSGTLALHRRVAMMKEHDEAFATPVLRRNRNRSTQSSVPSSEKNLGKMHFIRSVLEHHKNGGDADQIESEFHAIMNATTPSHSQEASINNGKKDDCGPHAPHHILNQGKSQPSIYHASYPSVATKSNKSPSSSLIVNQNKQISNELAPPPLAIPLKKKSKSLTAEQIARIENNRQRALMLRQQKMGK